MGIGRFFLYQVHVVYLWWKSKRVGETTYSIVIRKLQMT